jgi:hypothetical protein
MNVVLIIPTGIGAELGGHAGDANPIAKLIGKCCDKLITHPNVVNASDINEMPENTLYVEGSILDRFLNGEIYLQEVFYNKILLVMNKPLINDTINAVNAARTTIGADIEILELNTPLEMVGYYDIGVASGIVLGYSELIKQVKEYDLNFDALAIQTQIKVDKETKFNYLRNGGVNPWGGVEAIASKLIANAIHKPVAHAPFVNWSLKEDDLIDFYDVVDPRSSAEMVSLCYLHCVLKGLHKAPRINFERGLSNKDINFMISPINCFGEPHFACMKAGIPIIMVKENKTILNDKIPCNANIIIVDNYLEAVGVLMAFKAGVTIKSIRRPLNF